MRVIVEIPDDIAASLSPQGQDPARIALEALAIEGYRSGALTAFQTRRLLGFETRYELEDFLKARNLWEHAYTMEDLEQDLKTWSQFESEHCLRA